jgi:hypothetical protein
MVGAGRCWCHRGTPRPGGARARPTPTPWLTLVPPARFPPLPAAAVPLLPSPLQRAVPVPLGCAPTQQAGGRALWQHFHCSRCRQPWAARTRSPASPATPPATTPSPEFKMLLKERSSGMYRVSAFYFSTVAADLPMDTVLPVRSPGGGAGLRAAFEGGDSRGRLAFGASPATRHCTLPEFSAAGLPTRTDPPPRQPPFPAPRALFSIIICTGGLPPHPTPPPTPTHPTPLPGPVLHRHLLDGRPARDGGGLLRQPVRHDAHDADRAGGRGRGPFRGVRGWTRRGAGGALWRRRRPSAQHAHRRAPLPCTTRRRRQSWGLLLGAVFMNPKTAQTVASVMMLAFMLVRGRGFLKGVFFFLWRPGGALGQASPSAHPRARHAARPSPTRCPPLPNPPSPARWAASTCATCPSGSSGARWGAA